MKNIKTIVIAFTSLMLLNFSAVFAQFGGGIQIPDTSLYRANFLIAADINGDGKNDIVVGSQGKEGFIDGEYRFVEPGKISIFLNEGTGIFSSEFIIEIPGDSCYGLEAGDVDNDGDQDLICSVISDGIGPEDSGIFLYRNTGFGNFNDPILIHDRASKQMILRNIYSNSNEYPDLIFLRRAFSMDPQTNGVFGTVMIAKNNNGSFSTPETVIHSHLPTYVMNIDIGDINNDGLKDILVGASNSGDGYTINWYENIPGNDGFSNSPNIISTEKYSGYIKLLDIDVDNDLDVVGVRYGVSKGMAWFENDGFGQFGNSNQIPIDLCSPKDVHVGDIDLNGTNDLIVTFLDFPLAAWFPVSINQGTFEDYVPVNLTVTTPKEARDGFLADLDNDGDLDYIVTTINDDLFWFRNEPSTNSIVVSPDNLIVTPNPSNGNSHVMFNLENDSEWEVHVHTLSGNLVQSQSGFNSGLVTVDLNALAEGIYIINAHFDNTILSTLLIVQ